VLKTGHLCESYTFIQGLRRDNECSRHGSYFKEKIYRQAIETITQKLTSPFTLAFQ
jgi:hypothetical protein